MNGNKKPEDNPIRHIETDDPYLIFKFRDAVKAYKRVNSVIVDGTFYELRQMYRSDVPFIHVKYAKRMAKDLKILIYDGLDELTHTQCLHIIGKFFGYKDWDNMAENCKDIEWIK